MSVNDYDYAKRLGIICHYCADFFCFAHNSGFKGNLRGHMRYESTLEHFCRNNYQKLFNIDYIPYSSENAGAEKALDMIAQLNDDFKLKPQNYLSDIISALKACSLAGMAVLNDSLNLMDVQNSMDWELYKITA